jgi:hypothetical protein
MSTRFARRSPNPAFNADNLVVSPDRPLNHRVWVALGVLRNEATAAKPAERIRNGLVACIGIGQRFRFYNENLPHQALVTRFRRRPERLI